MRSRSTQIFLALFLAGISIAQRPASTNTTWVRGVVRAAKFVDGKDSHETFQLQVIRNDGGSLIGMAVITREMSQRHPNHSAIEVKGDSSTMRPTGFCAASATATPVPNDSPQSASREAGYRAAANA